MAAAPSTAPAAQRLHGCRAACPAQPPARLNCPSLQPEWPTRTPLFGLAGCAARQRQLCGAFRCSAQAAQCWQAHPAVRFTWQRSVTAARPGPAAANAWCIRPGAKSQEPIPLHWYALRQAQRPPFVYILPQDWRGSAAHSCRAPDTSWKRSVPPASAPCTQPRRVQQIAGIGIVAPAAFQPAD